MKWRSRHESQSDGTRAGFDTIRNTKEIHGVEWIVEGDVIKVVPLPKDPVAAFRGRGSRRCSTEQLIAERRAERKREDERDRRN